MIAAHVVRIANPAIRIPLWYLLYPFEIIDLLTSAVLDGEWRRLFKVSFWRFTASIFWVGHDGVLVGMPMTKEPK